MPYDLPRIPLPTTASSADLARLPAAIRRQALFSARLNTLGPLARIGAEIKGILDGNRSPSEARRDIRAALREAGYQPPAGQEGTLLDHTSRTRLDLILQQNVRAARGYGKWAADMDPGRLDLWPAQELVRLFRRRQERDWRRRWQDAGGRLHGGRMIALKTSPVWVNISRFGQPWPPFDYGSGMGVADIGREEAVRLGLLTDTGEITPEPLPFPDMAEARLPDLAAMPALRDAILKVFGPGARFEAGVLSIAPGRDDLPAAGAAAALGLGALSESTVTPAPARVAPGEARRLIESGEAVGGAPGSPAVRIGRGVERHWQAKGYSRKTIDSRLMHLRHALAALREPQEVWQRGETNWYLREFGQGADGKAQRILVQTDKDGRVITWIPTSSRPRYFEGKRTGALLAREGA